MLKFKKYMLRACAYFLVLVLLCGSMISCSSSGETLMKIGKQELSVNMYELLLSRMKGTLKYNGQPTDTEAFWDTIISTQGATYNDYFCLSIQQEAKKMLIKLYLFEEVYGLTLPQSNYDAIDQYIEDALDMLHDGSKTSFNQELSLYGVNMDMLRENYIIEDKIDVLKSYLLTQTGDLAKDEYYQTNYVRFRQILLPLYEYIYETDENGDNIYYQEGSDRICYDTTGVIKTGTDGKTIVDVNGDTIYYTENGRIAYNQKKGELHGVDKDKDGYTDYRILNEEEAAAVAKKAQDLSSIIMEEDFAMFEDYGRMLSEPDLWEAYPNGIFLNKNKNYSVAYLDDIQKALTNMSVGETALIKSENAYHFIMKYELTDHAYSNNENSDWFGEFNDEVVEDILDAMCEKYMDKVEVYDDILAKAKTMKEIGANTGY